MKVFRSATELAERIASENSFVGGFLLGVDGYDGSGKTALSRTVEPLVSASLVSLDDYLVRDRDAYVSVLKIPEIQGAVASHSGPVIVEGVCLLAALERAKIKVSRLIYVKKIFPFGLWKDEDECEPPEDIAAFLEKQNEDLRVTSRILSDPGGKTNAEREEPRLTGFREELIRYHWKYRPSRRADYIFERIDD